jgi:hypothetical protein
VRRGLSGGDRPTDECDFKMSTVTGRGSGSGQCCSWEVKGGGDDIVFSWCGMAVSAKGGWIGGAHQPVVTSTLRQEEGDKK